MIFPAYAWKIIHDHGRSAAGTRTRARCREASSRAAGVPGGSAADRERVGGQAVLALEQRGCPLEHVGPPGAEHERVADADEDQADGEPGQRVERARLAWPQVTPDRYAQHDHPDDRRNHPQPDALADAA